ncbi:TetR/AcrR family transcriptional regulator [Catenulispora sp. NF23]|uniref:TetR/AcrR family transcriptional regulator n=1 Tax=Catenulispora pinistramenti TaxID=2705254 RepID=UPI001BA8BD85|nr:TetR/AcrR family transcriptional regulator [Catenulispora pinistramenti]MBS2534219.1 TetR/AcrR family transcriptional regulator [Catenulispora pinistramenti]
MSPRADAAQNRERILAAARTALAASKEVRLSSIAREAGVGQGTLYRHFPTREDLLAAAYEREVDELAVAAPRLLQGHPPLTALRLWLGEVADYARVKRGLIAAVEATVWHELTDASITRVASAIDELLRAGRQAGAVRDDVDARDVTLLIGFLTRIDEEEWDTRARHLLDVLLDGLRRC